MAMYPNLKKSQYEKAIAIEPYLYSGNVSLTSGSAGVITFTIDSNIDYDWHSFTYKSTGEFKFQPVINQKELFKNYVNNYGFPGRVGSTQIGMALWYKFRVPLFVGKSSTITINVTDLSSASNAIEFTLDGVKLVYNP